MLGDSGSVMLNIKLVQECHVYESGGLDIFSHMMSISSTTFGKSPVLQFNTTPADVIRLPPRDAPSGSIYYLVPFIMTLNITALLVPQENSQKNFHRWPRSFDCLCDARHPS